MGQFVACASYFAACASYYNSLGKKVTDIVGNLAGIGRVEELLEWETEEDFPGEKVAFVGRSGEGKSTLLQLLCRFYAPWEGEIRVDDVPLTEYTLAGLRRHFAVVQQENGLFHGSLRENIILSEDRGQDALIWEILEGLKLKEMAEQWPEGLDTVIGSGSREMSGGQKQRLLIARLFLQDTELIVFDEATSALDYQNESEILNLLLQEETAGKTFIMVTYRETSVARCSRVILWKEISGEEAVSPEGDRVSAGCPV